MKITQLPKATAVTDSDIAVIVQDGETRQIPRSLLAPKPPDDITIDNGVIHLTADGKPIGTGTPLPVPPDGLQVADNILQLTKDGVPTGQGVPLPAPWAKQITYNKESLQDIMRVSAYKDSVNDKICAEFVVDFVSLMYQRNETEILSVTPLLSEIPPITVVVDSADEYKTQVYIDPKCVNISESFHLNVDGEALDVSIAELQFLALDNNAQFERFVQALRSAESGTSDGLGVLRYTYRFLLPPTETEMQNAIYDEICVLLRDHLTDFTVQYSEITYTKNAEVLKIE